MSSCPLFAGLAAVTVVVGLAGQRPVATVGGTSPDYPDLPQAVAAVAPGTLIDVRPGVYTGFDCQKELRIVLTNASIVAPAGASYTIRVHDLVGTDGFAMRGTSSNVGTGLLAAVRVENNLAPVAIENVTVFGGPFQAGLDVVNSGTVHVARSFLIGSPGLQAQFGNMVSNENIIGNSLGAGAIISDAMFESSRTIFLATDQPGLRLFNSSARLSSDGTGGVIVIGSSTAPVSAIEAFDSSIEWQPSRFLIQPLNGAAPLASVTTTELLGEVPMLNAGPAEMGNIATVRMTMGLPAPAVIAMSSLLPAPIMLGPAGLFLEPATYSVAAVGIADPTGLIANMPVPTNPTLRGEVFAFQGLAFTGNGVSKFSGPALWYLY